MAIEKTHTLVIGGGQAGLAMSEHLSHAGLPHLILERHRIAERWRSERWDSLVANGPAWHDRFPSMTFADVGIEPEAFASKEKVADYFVAYAEKIKAPIRCGVEVKEVRRLASRPGFRIETTESVIEANSVVAATGAFQRPVIPPIISAEAGITQIHSNAYRNPEQFPKGAVLVIGAGSSGTQIADELSRAGRQVYLSIGPHDRPPRRYRGRDFVWWLGVLGKWDAEAPAPDMEHVTISVSGAYGGRTIDFRQLAKDGMTLLGMTTSFEDGVLRFAPDLQDNLKAGDASYLSLLNEADTYVTRNGLDLPKEPEAHRLQPDPPCVTNPLLELDLAKGGVSSIIWATGYAFDYGWLKVDAFDENGKPKHRRGVSAEQGVYFLGLPWQSRRGSSFIWGVWHDAKHLADHIATQVTYQAYKAPAERMTNDNR